MKYLFLDVETTGTEEKDRLCQIAFKVTGVEVNALFKPAVPISIEAMSITNITNKMVEGKPQFIDSTEYNALSAFLQDPEITLVAHNAPFDVGFLLKEGIVVPQYICTMKLAHALDKDGVYGRHTLQYLRYFHDIEVDGKAHDAMGDVSVLERLFEIYQAKMTHQEMIEITSRPILLKKVPFGKHKGVKFSDVPKDYIMWLRRQIDLDENLKYTLDYWLNK